MVEARGLFESTAFQPREPNTYAVSVGDKNMRYSEIAGDVSDVAKKVGDTLLSSYADKVKIETTLFNTELHPGTESKPGKVVSLGLKLLRPKLTIVDNQGHEVYKDASYGEPKEIAGLVKAGLVGTILGIGALTFAVGRASK